ncbi:MAG: acetate--CoA ligase family protein, partial [Nitrososphaeria archaeon]
MDSSLKRLYDPSTIAVVGSSPNRQNLATIILDNLIRASDDGSLKAKVYAVNPLHDECLGLKCRKELENGTDLVIIAVPSRLAVDYLTMAQDLGAGVAIVIAGGFSESGGKSLRPMIHGTRVLGPNTIGIVDTYSGINTLFLPRFKKASDGTELRSIPDPKRGRVSIIAQSGGISVSLYDELLSSGIGIRALTCLGNSDDIDAAEVIKYFADDSLTDLIAIYLEGVNDGKKLMNSVSRASLKKRVIAMIAGISDAGKRATSSHTGSIVKNSDVYFAAVKQAGALVVNDFRDFITLIKSYQMLGEVKGRGVAVLTNSGGAGVLAADEAVVRGMNVPPLHDRLISLKENGTLPSIASVENPVDVSASGDDRSIVSVYRSLLTFDDINSIVIITTHYPPGVTDSLPSAIASLYKEHRKPTLAVELGKSQWSYRIRELYDANGLPSVDSPQQASSILALLYNMGTTKSTWHPILKKNIRTLYPGTHIEPDIIEFLTQFGFKNPKWCWIDKENDLDKIEYPIVLKVFSDKLIHKTEAGAVRVDIKDRNDAIFAYRQFRERFSDGRIYAQEMVRGVEVRVGILNDDTFGKYVDIGIGGTLTELLKDHSTRIAPVDIDEVLKMLGELRAAQLLMGYRGREPADVRSLAKSISALSVWAASYNKLMEIEI